MIRATILSLALIGAGLMAQTPKTEAPAQDETQLPPRPEGQGVPEGTCCEGKRPGGPEGMRPGGPEGQRPGGPVGMRPGGPVGMRPGGPEGMRPGGPEGMRPGGPDLILKALGLSKEQEKAVQALLEKRRTEEGAKHKAAFEKQDALRSALEDPATTESQLRSLHAAASDAQYQIHLAQRAVAQEINALLTPEQQAKAKRLREALRKEREGRKAVMEEMGHGPQGHPGPQAPPPQPPTR